MKKLLFFILIVSPTLPTYACWVGTLPSVRIASATARLLQQSLFKKSFSVESRRYMCALPDRKIRLEGAITRLQNEMILLNKKLASENEKVHASRKQIKDTMSDLIRFNSELKEIQKKMEEDDRPLTGRLVMTGLIKHSYNASSVFGSDRDDDKDNN